LAFIPQFINLSAGHVPLQFLAMGIICVALNTGADLVAVLSAARLQRRLLERPQMFKRLRQGSGLLMVSLGAGVLAMKRG
jgi:threonine/homoserine/homoserine lactone efflux protein